MASASSKLSVESPSQGLNERSLEALDWPQLIEALRERAATSAGQRACGEDLFAADLQSARARLRELGEVLALAERGASLQLGGIEDVQVHVQASVKGDILDGEVLLAIGHTLESLARLQRQLQEHAAECPSLAEISRGIQPLPDLAAWLVSSFDARGELSSSTWPELRSLRSRKASLHEKIGATLGELRRDERVEAALQDDFLAMRNDRYVLPVKVQHKSSGLGIVHDASGSGQTVFIEPFEVVGMNNDLKLADSELRREELRILRDLSERVSMLSADILSSLAIAVRLDLLAARGRLAEDLEATLPELSETPIIALNRARHPLLVLRGIEVVANDIALGGEAEGGLASCGLVLSGPNTGGKTVTLKTLGLAALMVRAGMALPCDKGSVVGWFPRVLTDIGDAQDLQDDLSTFSGHLLHMRQILEALESSTEPGLVLVDELAAGTDPVQGAALARALLEAFIERRALVVTTTHYPDIKALSSGDGRFLNARVEFDPDSGGPTYRLASGLAGSSHALDVARAMGLPEPLLAAARGFLGEPAARVEDVLSDLERAAGAAAQQREEAELDRKEAAEELEKLRGERDELLRRSRGIETQLRAEFEEEVRGYRDAVRGALKQLRERADEASAERARQRIAEGANRLREVLSSGTPRPQADRIDPDQLSIGDRVRVASLGKDATLVSAPGGRARVVVDVDGLRVEVKVTELERARTAPAAPSKGLGRSSSATASVKGRKARSGAVRAGSEPGPALDSAWRSPALTLDLRGERVDDALEKLDAFLDQQMAASQPFAFVLHGHGTGALKAAVRQALRSSPYVSQFAPGNRSQGGDGITVAQIQS